MFGLTPYKKNNGLVRPEYDFFSMDSMFDRFFGDSFFPTLQQDGALLTQGGIKVDVKESEKEYEVIADLPGVEKENITVDFKDDRLMIRVEQNESYNEERDNYIRRERKSGSMSRSFYIENVDQSKIEAKFDNGVLNIRLPKTEGKEEKNSRIRID